MPRKRKPGRPRKHAARSKTTKTKKQARQIKEKRPKLNIFPETKRGVISIILFALAVIFILSFQGVGGVVGEYILEYSEFVFGACLWLIPLVFLAAGIIILRDIHESIYLSTLLGVVIFILSFLAIVHIFLPGERQAGWLGYIISWPFLELIGFWASLVIFSAALVISILIGFNIPLRKMPKEEEEEEEEAVAEKTPKGIKGIGFAPPEKRMGRLIKGIFKKPRFEMKETGGEIEEESVSSKVKDKETKEELLPTTHPTLKDYTFPSIDLLEADKGYPSSGDIKANMNIIEKTLENFNIPVEMGEVNVGPTVTQYTFRPASGVKLAKITALQHDISLALAAHPIRMEAPIPGRSLVGIEIPNKTATLVRLRNLLTGFDYKKDGHNLNVCLGRDVAGHAIWANLVKMPHLLIAGATGSGKSICIHSIISTLLYQKSPWELKFILIDPKRVELTFYNGIPHLLTPVIVELNKVINAFKWAIKEMEERYRLLSDVKAKDLATYNEKIAKTSPKEILPYIVIIVDELADIMAAYGKEVEGAVVRLAQMSRAVGIHLIISTQRPSVEVITGLIKANITSRIAFQVASQVDSRTILDMAGADRLLGNGDMLFLAGDVGKPRRIQSPYTSEKEVKKIVNFLRKQAGEPEYEEEITAAVPEGQIDLEGRTVSFDDSLLEEAKDLVIATGKASASYLQRRFRIGYARAASILDMLEQKGIVGPADGAKPRKVLTGKPVESDESEIIEDVPIPEEPGEDKEEE